RLARANLVRNRSWRVRHGAFAHNVCKWCGPAARPEVLRADLAIASIVQRSCMNWLSEMAGQEDHGFIRAGNSTALGTERNLSIDGRECMLARAGGARVDRNRPGAGGAGGEARHGNRG